ncbi:MAG: molecular chaperone DnaJ [Candidatus Buchananbacteria bacterium]|nr:molecular chaperone DnaJ [Candidatus Buchananbacteria bacterium]
MAKDYYELLGVPKAASADDIKKAFRKLAHEHHPDKASGNADKFKEINEAYQTLSNPEKRRQYDQFGNNYQDFSRAQGGNPFGGGAQYGGANFDFGEMGDLGDLFGSFFGGSAQRPTASRGDDLEVEVMLEFQEAVFGVEKTIELDKKITCDRCHGNGGEPGSKVTTCPTCHGNGRITRVQQTFLGNLQTQTTCPECRGDGKKIEHKCTQCHGQGSVRGSERIKVIIPGGIENGQAIRMGSKGEAGPGGTGDLYVRVRIKPSTQFERDGNTILSEAKISIRQAILGDSIDVETVDGPVKLKIPEGTQSHTQFRLRDKGVPHLNRSGRGDHLVNVVVEIPKKLSRKDRKVIEGLEI